MAKKLFNKAQRFAERTDSFGNVIVFDAAYEEAIAFLEKANKGRTEEPYAEHRFDNNTLEHSVWDGRESDVREGQAPVEEAKPEEKAVSHLGPEDLEKLAELIAEKLKKA
jgi:hypothetical protein